MFIQNVYYMWEWTVSVTNIFTKKCIHSHTDTQVYYIYR